MERPKEILKFCKILFMKGDIVRESATLIVEKPLSAYLYPLYHKATALLRHESGSRSSCLAFWSALVADVVCAASGDPQIDALVLHFPE